MTTQQPGMRDQIAAQSVIEELLRQQLTMPPRTRFARFWGINPLAADSVAWYRGAQGEIEVGKILSRLPPEWRVFHALPIGKASADIDHLVVGPGGIFTINTKHHRGKKIWIAERSFLVNGQKQPYLRNSTFEATRVTKKLHGRMPQLPPAQAVIALVNPASITIKKKPDGVSVLDATDLRRWLLRRPVQLDEVQLVELAAIIDAPASWSAPASPTSSDLMAQFALIDGEVKTARVRRVTWTLLSFATVATLVVFVGVPLYEKFALGFSAPSSDPYLALDVAVGVAVPRTPVWKKTWTAPETAKFTG
ncbi:nuclease-related domain-containing protein [Cryobacterium sp. PH31-L1]|uniref:nuclease-related domain-containing protein n=1 Tax=Cryobacterium sp. PH31-L1 TaxID=3046199 RepID=UPI0024B8C0C8|nr:nuclease-related domain-containing protein [Cryobacterium sp. PH31-L1]MDJ0376438.1 nuclease-related domain-containing protein [Cryobacterium sp. PH31-L1]